MKVKASAHEGNAKNKPVVGENVLSLFWDLASLEKAVRERAASSLVDKVLADQKVFLKQDGNIEAPSTSDSYQTKQLNAILSGCCPTAVYTVKRLCQGLASSRKGARQGFAAALTVLLERADWLKPDQVVAVIKLLLSPAGSAKKSEGKEMLIGQLFGYGAVVRAHARLTPQVAVVLADRLAYIADKKTFLRQAACSLVLDLANALKEADIKRVFSEVEGLKALLTAPIDKASPEGLMLALRLWGRMPADVAQACPLLPNAPKSSSHNLWNQGVLSRKDAGVQAAGAVLNEDHIKVLLPVLRASTSCHPRMHTVWHTLLALLIPGYNADGEGQQVESQSQMDTAQLKALWGLAVEEDIFNSASHERKYLGFVLFKTILPYAQPDQVAVLFSPTFLRTLSKNATNKDTYLHASAKKCIESIQSVKDESSDEIKGAILAALQHPAAQAVKAMIRKDGADKKVSKEHQDKVQDVPTSNLPAHVQELSAAFARASADVQGGGGEGSQSQHKWQSVVNQLSAIVKKADAPAAVKQSILSLLATYAFGPTHEPSAKQKKVLAKYGASSYTVLPPGLRQWCASRVISLADTLTKTVPQRGKSAEDANGVDHAAPRHDHLNSVVEAVKAVQASNGPEEPANASYEAWSGLRTHLAALDTAAGEDRASTTTRQSRLRSMQHLVSLLELYVLADQSLFDEELASDFQQVCDDAFNPQGPPAPPNDDDKDDDQEEDTPPYWMDVLTDGLLSLLASTSFPLPSAPARDGAERVFKAFCDDLTVTGLSDMMEVLTRPLEAPKDEDDAAGDDDMEEEEGGDGGESDMEQDEEEESEEEAAGVNNNNDDDESSDDEGATDQQMFQMDEKLAAYFSSMRVDRAGKKTQLQELINFKLRILACFEAFIRKVPDSPLLPLAVDPLLTALIGAARQGGNKVLAERLAGIIQHRLSRSKGETAGSELEEDDLKALLHRSLYLASRSEDKSVAAAAGAAYVYVQRVAVGGAGGAIPAAATESLQVALDDYFNKKKSRLSHNLMLDLLRRVPQLAAVSLEELIKQAGGGRNEYLKLEAFALAEAALQSVKSSFSDLAPKMSSSLADMLVSGIKGPFTKVQRHMQALKACHQFAIAFKERCGGASSVLSSSSMRAIKSAAADLDEGNTKVQAQVQRLLAVLAEAAPKAKAAAKRGPKEAPASVKKPRVTRRTAAMK